MDKNLLRMILLIAGVILLLGIYLWDRYKKRKKRLRAPRYEYPEVEPAQGMESFSLNPAEEAAADIEIDSLRSADSPASEEEAIPQEPVKEPAERPPLIQISVVAKRGGHFNGAQLLQAFADLELKYGAMGIFHRHDPLSNAILFSAASLVNPGTFPIDEMDSFQCPGVTLFMQPRELDDPLEAFDGLVATCHELASRLDGVEWDAQRRPLSLQAIGEMRQQLIARA